MVRRGTGRDRGRITDPEGGISMTEPNHAEDAAHGTAACIRDDIEAAADPVEAAANYVQWDALDVHYVVDRTGAVRDVYLTVGTGGPHVELHWHVGTEHVEVMAWSGRDRARVEVHAPALAAELDILADQWQDVAIGYGANR